MLVSNPDIWVISHTEIAIRIVVALVLGGLIGLERELGDHPAGFRTHILVCIGSALLVILSIYGFAQFAYEPNVRMDPARLAAQVVTGIGFLGAGTIMRTGLSITGLTTAASLWVVAAIGLSVGAGFYVGALITTFVAIISLFLLNKLEKTFSRSRQAKELVIELWDNNGSVGKMMSWLEEQGIRIVKLHMESFERLVGDRQRPGVKMNLVVKSAKPKGNRELLARVMSFTDVISVNSNLLEPKSARQERKEAKRLLKEQRRSGKAGKGQNNDTASL